MDTIEICPSQDDISKIKSPTIKLIASNKGLRNKLKLCILLAMGDILDIFKITEEELKEFKDNFFRADLFPSQVYIVNYLESTGQSELLTAFLEGPIVARATLGIPFENPSNVLKYSILHKALKSNSLDLQMKCFRLFPEVTREVDKLDKYLESLNAESN